MDYIDVRADGITAGTIHRAGGTCSFNYHSGPVPPPWVSLTMPYRPRSWNWTGELHPIFEMNLPEGYLFELLKQLVLKEYGTADDFSMLSLLSGNIRGRLEYASPRFHGQNLSAPPMTLPEILSSSEEDLFARLLGMFLESSFISGIQPKLLARLFDKALVSMKDYLVKTWGEEYPRLAENEYFCMQAVKKAGIPVPPFSLSDNRKLFVVERFDRSKDGNWLGFEELCVLQAKTKREKYSGSYEQAAKTIASFVSPDRRASSLSQFFKMLVISILLRNGDAHLKNFGILYSPDREDRWLSPCYDVVTTTAYVVRDKPALSFMGRKFWPGKKQLIDFGRTECMLGRNEAGALYDECAQAVFETSSELESYCAATPGFALTGRRMLASWASSRDREPKKDIGDEILGNGSIDQGI